MSGLAVLIGDNASPSAVEAMLCSAPHRGEVKALHSGPGWALGIQALSTQSVFVAPAIWTGGGVAVAMTGCLYRGQSLVVMEEAAQRMGEAFLADGPAGLAALKGSFAAVMVTTTDSNPTTAIRSPMGERPMFWRVHKNAYAFASEIKQLLAAPMPMPSKDPEGALNMIGRPEEGDRTTYLGVHRLPAGHWIEMSSSPMRRRFWDKRDSVGTSRATLQEALEEFRRLLRIAVLRRLDRGAGMLLSGGLDSSAVAVEAAPLHLERYGAPLRVVSAAYPDIPEVDEWALIQSTAKRLGCHVTWVYPRPRPFDDLDGEVWLQDGPDAALMTANGRLLFRGAHEAGVRVCLDGHDGDSVFGTLEGLPRALIRRGKLVDLRRYARFVRTAGGMGASAAFRRVVVPGLVDFVPALRTSWRRFRPVSLRPPWIPSWTTGLLHARLASLAEPSDWFETQWLYASTAVPLGVEIIERIGLSQGLTLLHPLADPDLADFLLSLPPEVKFSGAAPKGLVRLAYSTVLPEVISRMGKTEFGAVAAAGSPPDELLKAVFESPRKLSSVDWTALEHCLTNGGVPPSQLGALRFAICADRFISENAP